MKKTLIAAVLMGAMMAPGAVLAQGPAAAQAPDLKVGATVYGPKGGEVGTIEKVVGNVVVVFTGKNRASLGKNAFGKGPKGPVIGMTKAQLDTAIEQAAAKAKAAKTAALAPGADIRSKDGIVVGKVKSVQGDNVVIDITNGGAITLKKNHLTTDANGLKLFMTAAQFQSAVNSATAKTGAALDAVLAPDAQVRSSDGVVIGKVRKVDGDNVIVDLPSGKAITLKKQNLTTDANGLKLFMTAAQFQAAVNGATKASAPS